MATGEHDRIIAAAAKVALSPIGFQRNGRSRLWFADRGYWLSVAEFQPSGFSNGSYLNVAAFWLWSPNAYISFDRSLERYRTFIGFESAEQFRPLAEGQAALAAKASRELEALQPNLPSIRDYLVEHDAQSTRQGLGDAWQSYHAAIATGMLGDMDKTRAYLRASRERFASHLPHLVDLVDDLDAVCSDHARFSAFVHARIDAQRSRFGLAPLGGSLAPSTSP